MEQINAPYNFVPLADQVVFPEWADQVSHDLPFKDGICGELELTITAQSPILVGGSKENDGKHVHFFKMGGSNGKYAIPGSSLRGMFRSVMEIATFSRMNNVDDKSYGLRDISKSGNVYHDRISTNVKTGFLRMEGKSIKIIPCEMARLDHRDLEGWLGRNKPIFNKKAHKRVSNKYSHWKKIASSRISDDGGVQCQISGVETEYGTEFIASAFGKGSIKAYPVFTGQISDSTNDKQYKDKKDGKLKWRRGKHKDFVFYNLNLNQAIDIQDFDSKAWGDFLFIHHDAEPNTNTDMSWPNYWREQFRDGKDVPVFYLQDYDNKRLQIGLAYLPKLAGDFSTYDMIRNTSEKHLVENGFDFTSLVFGKVGKEPEDALKGRVFFEPAMIQGNEQPTPNPPATILNGAKPSYFPNYIKQDTDKAGAKLAAGKEYATYIRTIQNERPEIRGWKRYPARPEYMPISPSQDNNNDKVTTRLHVLPQGTTFKSRLVVHNLKPVELGALLWSIQLESGHQHSIGMGKSFGAGQLTVSVESGTDKLFCNDPSLTKVIDSSDNYIKSFKSYISKKLKTKWEESEQIKSLLSMTYPEGVAQRFKGKLIHMQLKDENKKNQFVTAKQAKPPLVLGNFSMDIRKEPKIKTTDEVWERAKILYSPGNRRLTATCAKKGTAILEGSDAKQLFDTFSRSAQTKAKKGQLLKKAIVIGKGNSIKINNLE